jgi:DNA-binding response OmpR family regulator
VATGSFDNRKVPPADSLPTTSVHRILIVDDDRSVIETFSRMLRFEGFDVQTAVNPETGLQLAAERPPDAIILDLRMPLLNGLQFLRLLRAHPHLATTPVAIVTGDYFIDDQVVAEIRALGGSIRFKPLWLEDLVALARTLVAT